MDSLSRSIWFRCLVVALATLGTGIDAMPISLIAAFSSTEADGEDPAAPREESQEDETPDDVSDLSWPPFRMIAGRREARPRTGWAALQRLDWLNLTRSPRRRGRRPAPENGAGPHRDGLPITLCRLTC